MNRSSLQRHLAHRVSLSLGAGLILWLCILIKGAFTFRDFTGAAEYDIRAGALLLHKISRQPLDDGWYTISFSFEQGAIWYILLFCLLGLVWGCAAHRLHEQRAHRKE